MASIAAASALILLAGCASAPSIAVLEPVGPAPAAQATHSNQGSLQVYSARQKAGARDDLMEWEWDYDFGKNAFAYGLAHTDYILRTEEGIMLEYVRNATNAADPKPALVSLTPGRYKVEAQAEEADGQTVTVMLPVLIEPGRTTVAHLSGHWRPQAHYTNAEVVRLPDGHIAGWLAAH